MKRGSVVIVSAAGDYGEPRPAVIVQSDVFPDTHASVIVCQMTSSPSALGAEDFRVAIGADNVNGLREPSRIMVDKPVTVRRERIGTIVGQLSTGDMNRVDAALAFVLGLSD